MNSVPRIEAVSVVGPSRLKIVWRNTLLAEEIDLSQWIVSGGEILAPLRDADVFSKAAVSSYGAAVTWDSSDGDLSIDAYHLMDLGGLSKAL